MTARCCSSGGGNTKTTQLLLTHSNTCEGGGGGAVDATQARIGHFLLIATDLGERDGRECALLQELKAKGRAARLTPQRTLVIAVSTATVCRILYGVYTCTH